MITSVKYLKDDKDNNFAVKIVYDNNTAQNIQTKINPSDYNRFWKDVEEWVLEGNTIEEAD